MQRIFYPALNDLGDRKKGDPVALEIPVDAGLISDGYHSFNELYDHRCLLFCVILEALGRGKSKTWDIWRSRRHHDGTSLEGWFIAGATPHQPGLKGITYHLPNSMWDYIKSVPALERAPVWDGHTSQDTIERMKEWLSAERQTCP